MEIESWLEENYDALVAAGRRTYADIEKMASEAGDKTFAAWARKRQDVPEKAKGKRTTAQPEEVNPNEA